jgi:hypothetical protein
MENIWHLFPHNPMSWLCVCPIKKYGWIGLLNFFTFILIIQHGCLWVKKHDNYI